MGNNAIIRLATLFGLASLAACSGGVSKGGSGGSAGSGGSTTTTTHTSTSGATTSGDTTSGVTSGVTTGSGSSGAGGSGGSDCLAKCESDNPGEFLKFGINLLTDCGCTMAAACSNECGMYCSMGKPSGAPADPSPCRDCLATEGGKKMSSMCATQAGIACIQDPTCSKFVNCALACP